MGVKLKAANGGGSVELDVPSTVNSDLALTVPATAGEIVVNPSSAQTSDTKLELTNTAAHCEFNIISKNDSGSIINMGDVDDYNIGRIKYDNSTDSMQIQTSNVERLRIASNGNITIGTASNPGGKLFFESSSGSAL